MSKKPNKLSREESKMKPLLYNQLIPKSCEVRHPRDPQYIREPSEEEDDKRIDWAVHTRNLVIPCGV